MGRLRPHLSFILVLATATMLRVAAMAAYFPALWFNDSFEYLRVGTAPFPDPIRPDGYGLLLWILRPFHSFALVVAVQHLMGLGAAVMIYTLVHRRLARPRWVAILATAPLLFDAYQVELEHLVMSDVLFTFLVVSATVIALWRRAVGPCAAGAIGLLLAVATLTRPVGLPLVLIFVGFLITRRASWPAIGAICLTAATPLTVYALWFHSVNGTFALTNTDGVFLWGRTAAFADCTKVEPPADLASMCPHGSPGTRAASSSQIWEFGSPTGWYEQHRFSAATNRRARRFALHAIATQPFGYLTAVGHGVELTFGWNRIDYPTAYTAGLYRFPASGDGMPATPISAFTELVRSYSHARPNPASAEPWAGLLRTYQRWVYLRGTMLAGVLLLGPAALLRRRYVAALPSSIGVALLALPLLTTDFDYRYVLPAVPFACLAAALAGPRLRVPPFDVTGDTAGPIAGAGSGGRTPETTDAPLAGRSAAV